MVIDHPVLKHKLTYLRKKETPPPVFRELVRELSQLMTYEATRDLKLGNIDIETPISPCQGQIISQDIIVVSILRAGNGMLDGVLQTLPMAKVGLVGMYRDKFINNTVEYYFKLPPNVEGQDILLVDPMLATGDTAIASIQRLKEYGVGKIRFLCLLSSQEAINRLEETHPDVELFTLSIEKELSDKGYLVPGLGDAGDRLFGTI